MTTTTTASESIRYLGAPFTLTVGRTQYTVRKFENLRLPEGSVNRVNYELVGGRGATYATMRNARTPSLLFVMGGRRGTRMMDFWLTDADGTLRVR